MQLIYAAYYNPATGFADYTYTFNPAGDLLPNFYDRIIEDLNKERR